MPRCVIINCDSPKLSNSQREGHISYHCFPNDPIVQEKWIAATGRKDWMPSKHSTICSAHFETNCFIEGKKLRMLKETAYPTIHILKLIDNEDEMSQQNAEQYAPQYKFSTEQVHIKVEPDTHMDEGGSEEYLSFKTLNEELVVKNEPATHEYSVVFEPVKSEPIDDELTDDTQMQTDNPQGLQTPGDEQRDKLSISHARKQKQRSKNEKEFIKELIELYRSFPCLWDIHSEPYKNVNKKKIAWETLLRKYREVQKDANELSVKKKIEALKCCYFRQSKKLKSPTKQVDPLTGEIRKPYLWYYDYMTFLDKRTSVNRSVTKTHMSQDEDDQPFKQEKKWSGTKTDREGKFSKENVQEQKKIKSSNSSQDLLQQKNKEVNSFALYVSDKIEQTHGIQREIAEKLISEVIFLARTNNLSIDSKIYSPPNLKTQPNFTQAPLSSESAAIHYTQPIQSPTSSHSHNTSSSTHQRNSPTVNSDSQICTNPLTLSALDAENAAPSERSEEILRDMLVSKK